MHFLPRSVHVVIICHGKYHHQNVATGLPGKMLTHLLHQRMFKLQLKHYLSFLNERRWSFKAKQVPVCQSCRGIGTLLPVDLECQATPPVSVPSRLSLACFASISSVLFLVVFIPFAGLDCLCRLYEVVVDVFGPLGHSALQCISFGLSHSWATGNSDAQKA